MAYPHEVDRPAGIPRAALGMDGDFPVPYAVFSVEVDEEQGTAVDSRYVYASEEYCRAISRDVEGIIGRSQLEVAEGDGATWLAMCYRAVAKQEASSGFWYDPLVRDWACYTITPSATEGHCVYSYIRVTVDDQQRRQLMATTDARTSLLISEMLSQLAAEQSYDVAMNGMLQMMSKVIHADRLIVFECRGDKTTATFELCGKGMEPVVGSTFPLGREMLAYWFRNVTTDRVVLVPKASVIERVSKPLYDWCVATGVESLLAAPFFSEGEIVGFLGAYNYQMDETIDLNRLFAAVSTFIAARIENRQLIDSLLHASSHDALTDLLNRRGAQEAMGELLEREPDGHYVLAVIDVDNFKRVNDVYGHTAGDEALIAMTRLLKETFPVDAILSRNGGDEFLVLLYGTMAEQASTHLANLTERGVSFDCGCGDLHLTVSVGYARYPEQATTMRDLFSKADAALYAVKLTGKNGFGKFTHEAEVQARFQLGFSAHDLLESVPFPLLVSRAEGQGEILFVSIDLAHQLGYAGRHELMQAARGSLKNLMLVEDRQRVQDSLDRWSREKDDGAARRLRFRMLVKGGGVLVADGLCSIAKVEETGQVLYALLSVKPE